MVDSATRKLVIGYIAHTVSGATAAAINSTAGTGSQALAFHEPPGQLRQQRDEPRYASRGFLAAGTFRLRQKLLVLQRHQLEQPLRTGPTCAAGEIRGNISPLPQ